MSLLISYKTYLPQVYSIYTNDKKKATGRALGTFIELITFYILKNWELEIFTAIERPLPEFANSDVN
jgi:hypothetical protein